MRAQAGKFTLCADGLCIGFDSADGVSEEFKGSSPFKGGTILRVGVSHEKKQYLDLERELRERLHGISSQFNFESDVTGSPNGLPVMVIANSRKQERFGEIAFRPAMLALAPEAIIRYNRFII